MSPPAHILDRCWGVPVVVFFSAFVVFMPACCAGLLYVLFMDEFGISHEMAAWPQSTYTVMANTIGAGAGFCMINLSLYLLLYFDKYRATATACKYVGGAASGIIGPTLLGYTAEKYGAKGAFLLVGAMALHAIPLVMLLGNPQPLTIPEWCVRLSAKDSTTPVAQNGGQHLAGGGEPMPKPALLEGRLTKRCNTNQDPNKDSVAKEKHTEKETLQPSGGIIVVTEVTKLDVPNLCSVNSAPPGNCQKKPVSAKQMRVDSPSLVGHYATLFRTPVFYVLLIAFTEIEYMMAMVNTTIVEYGIDKGAAALKDAKQLQTYQAMGQLVGRIVVPFVSDKIANSRCPLTAASLAVTAACLLLISRVNHFGTLTGLTALVGVCEGYLMCIRWVLVGDYLGVETVASVCGLLGVASVPALLSAPSIIGFFRDKLGSYDKFYWMLTAVSLMSACLMGGIAVKDKLRRKALDIDNPNRKPAGQTLGTVYDTEEMICRNVDD
ncbi:hypothetical protein HPB52_012423 [Rhipicephalus sanguineus]|uniref:Monocarboxylate transporter n=1 Tax=Rhipicephalus sanguineus TaxID=34632 RepID=A0A9D4SYA4_RHISA|nr:hypothetical protein HPB52_012423 [Rhipicephalus sanguineus]